MLNFITFLSLAASVSATSILLPMYIYPDDNQTDAWSGVNRIIAAYPTVQWQIIINPQSGPGTSASQPFPSDDYIEAIQSVKAFPNVQTIGYVDSLWTRRGMQAIKTDIDRYAVWANYSNGAIAMEGIFFDDVSSYWDFHDYPNTQAANETFYQEITSYAKGKFPVANPSIVCNTGNPSVPSFYNYCTTMVEFEDTYSDWTNQTIINTLEGYSGSGIMNRSAIIINTVPANLSSAIVEGNVHVMHNNKVEFVYMTHDCCYNAIDMDLLEKLASAVNFTATEKVPDNPSAASSATTLSCQGILGLFFGSVVVTLLTLCGLL